MLKFIQSQFAHTFDSRWPNRTNWFSHITLGVVSGVVTHYAVKLVLDEHEQAVAFVDDVRWALLDGFQEARTSWKWRVDDRRFMLDNKRVLDAWDQYTEMGRYTDAWDDGWDDGAEGEDAKPRSDFGSPEEYAEYLKGWEDGCQSWKAEQVLKYEAINDRGSFTLEEIRDEEDDEEKVLLAEDEVLIPDYDEDPFTR